MKLAEKIAWFRRDFVAILPVEHAACDTFEASTQTGARSRTPRGIDTTSLNLLILRKSKTEKNRKNAEVRYTAGTRYRPTFAPAFFGPTSEARPIWLTQS